MPMAPSNPQGRGAAAWVAVTVLVLIGTLGTLIVPIYARSTPKLGAFPFFYWYQLVWVPVVAILSWICYLLVRTKRAPGGGPANGGGASS
jgi:hypothetical protein